jgi:NAD(P)-dependent dehydrogenase (short-subunit alcohol dehydrogenase family)
MAKGFTHADVPAQSGRTFFVTGANTGIGFESARILAGRGARVLLGCRSRERAESAMREIEAETPGADLAFVELDQADLASVASAAEQVSAEPRLDVLVNNAGIMHVPQGKTADGFERHFGVNHLGTFALTAHLLRKLGELEGSRVVTTSSIAHVPSKLDFDDINAERRYQRDVRYGASKLANLVFVFELNRRLRAAGSNTISVGCHPGIAKTELTRHFGAWYRPLAPLVGRLFNTQLEGAWPTLMAATHPDAKGGHYYGPSRRFETAGPARRAYATATARDQEVGERLWALSVAMTGVDPGM